MIIYLFLQFYCLFSKDKYYNIKYVENNITCFI